MSKDAINATAVDAYKSEGPGIGGGEESIKRYPPVAGTHILDVGFGDCKCVRGAIANGVRVSGVDIAEASLIRAQELGLIDKGFCPAILDVSHDKLPYQDNVFDRAYCLEAIEHFSNPLYAFAEVKRVLKHKGTFVIVFPRPESNLGYGSGKHAHVYPGFLQKDSFERFMKQLYFKQLEHKNYGDSAWYFFENIKEGGPIVDVFKVVSGNYEDEDAQLYDWMKEV